jgi:Uma2 family endonuclease
MRPASRRTIPPSLPPLPLHTGDRLSQPEFHRRYEACPDEVKFELIGGIVYMSSPARRPHGTSQPTLSFALSLYQQGTPGVEVLDSTTTILDEESEPQPDLALRILPEWGGQSETDADDYVTGAPEWMAEIAHSNVALALRAKKEAYRRAGVREYLVVSLPERDLHWFAFDPEERAIRPDRKGIYRSRVFPGLWIDGEALLSRDLDRLETAVRRGLASRPHAAFVKRLEAARRKRSGS